MKRLALLALLIFVPAAHGSVGAGFGYNGHGELGPGYKAGTTVNPVPVLASPIKELAAGGSTVALLEDGSVVAWGDNGAGQLGDGTRESKYDATRVRLPEAAVQVASADAHSLVLLADGTVETWGSNLYGQLGLGTDGGGLESCTVTCRSLVPVHVPSLSGVVAVYAGGAFDAAATDTGAVFEWGENKWGQLGDGTRVRKDVPTLVKGIANVRTLALGGQGSLGGHTLALMPDGTVQAWGENEQGQLGDGTATARLTPVRVSGLAGVSAISAAWTHSLAIAGGRLQAWGSNKYGELGTLAPAKCQHALATPCALKPLTVPLAGVSAIAAGFASSYGVSAGRAYSWGKNDYGKLGAGNLATRTAPGLVSGLTGVLSVSAATTDAFALLESSTLRPGISVTSDASSITVSWEGTSVSNWLLTYRLAGTKFAPKVTLAPTTHSYTIAGLKAGRYEVAVQQTNSGGFGRRTVEARVDR